MKKDVRSLGLGVAASFAAVVLSLLLASVILLINGSNPLDAYWSMLEYSSQLENFIQLLNRATPLYLSAIAVAIGFRMNLFNIGVEGQYFLSALIAAQVAAVIALPAPLHLLIVILTAMSVGAVWAAIPGVLKVTRGIHEVISTIMLNTIAISFIVAILHRRWDVSTDFNIRTAEVPKSGQMPELNNIVDWFTRDPTRSLNGFLIVAILVGLIYWIYVYYTRPGYDLRASGLNPLAAQASGVSPQRTIILTMVLSGAIAGLVGLPQILGDTHFFGLDFTRMLGFNGIAVALLGQNHPGGIAVAALFFGFLDTAGPALQFEADAPPEIITIMKGIIIFVMVIAYEYARRQREISDTKRAAKLLQTNGSEG